MARIDIMKKACPFREFAECLKEQCMAWSGFDCRMFSVSPMLMTGISNPSIQNNNNGANAAIEPAAASQATETVKGLFTQDQLQNAAVMARQENQTEAESTNNKEEKQDKQNPVAKVTVMEFKVTKNGVGEMLQKGLNKKFEIEYNVMKDGDAWFAIKVKQL